MPPGKFTEFANAFPKVQLWRSFLNRLDESFDDIREKRAAPTLRQSVLSLHQPIIVRDPGLLPVGTLVSYRGATIQAASNAGYPANFAVGDVRDGKLYLYAGWHFGRLRIDPSRGTDPGAMLYLSTGGSTTDAEDDLTDADGALLPAVNFRQFLGERLDASGTPPNGYVYCTLRIGPNYSQ